MIYLSSKIRKYLGKKSRKAGGIPAVVYGPGQKNLSVDVDEKEFKKVLAQAGESSLVELSIEGSKEKRLVLVHDIQKEPISSKIIHIDFLQPSLTKEVTVKIPLVFEGIAIAEKDLGGTLVKNISEVEVKALPQDLPYQIFVNIEGLKTFEDRILVKDIVLQKGVKISKQSDEIVASVLPPQKVEEELAVPIEENVEGVEKVEKPKEEEEIAEEQKAEK